MCDFGPKIRLNFGEDLFFYFYFFGDHLFLGWKTVWIPDFGRKIRLNFGEDLFFFVRDDLFLSWKIVWISEFGRKIRLNFAEDLFFGDHLILGGKNVWTFRFPRNFVSIFGQTVWNWFKNNEKSGQSRFLFFSLFQKSPPSLFQILATRLPWSHDHGFNPHPGHVFASLNKTLYDDYLCLVALNKQQIYVGRSYRSTGKRKMVNS